MADGILNAALFLPLGAALSVAGWRPLRGLALGALLSCAAETAQFAIPGRDPSLSDVLFNTLGTALGVALVCFPPTWWRPKPRLAAVLTIAAGAGAMSVLAVTGILFGASLPEDTYYGGLAHRFGHLEWYGGRVLGASLDGLELPSGAFGRSGQVRQLLLSGATIFVRARAGPPPAGLAPLLTIHDRHQREILLLGVDGNDLVYRHRTRAVAWGLMGPEIRVRGAFRGIAWRAPVTVAVRREPFGFCVRVNDTDRCGLGYTLGTGWELLLGGQPVPLWFQPALRVIWLAALFFPMGLWVRSGRTFAMAAALSLAGLSILPTVFGLLPTPVEELFGVLAGAVAGTTVGNVNPR